MKKTNLNFYSRVAFLFLIIFFSSSVSALSIFTTTNEKGVITFTVTNDSKSKIQLNLGQFHRENIFLSIGYGNQVILKESWIPESSNYRMGVLEVGESISFDIDLNKRFEKFDQLMKTECLFLFWGGVFNLRGDKSVVKNGSVVLNNDVCIVPPKNEQFW